MRSMDKWGCLSKSKLMVKAMCGENLWKCLQTLLGYDIGQLLLTCWWPHWTLVLVLFSQFSFLWNTSIKIIKTNFSSYSHNNFKTDRIKTCQKIKTWAVLIYLLLYTYIIYRCLDIGHDVYFFWAAFAICFPVMSCRLAFHQYRFPYSMKATHLASLHAMFPSCFDFATLTIAGPSFVGGVLLLNTSFKCKFLNRNR